MTSHSVQVSTTPAPFIPNLDLNRCKWFLILATVGNKPIIHLGSGENRAMRKAAIQIPSPVYFAQSLEFWVPIAAIGHPTNINTTHSTAQYTALQHAIQRPILDDGTFSMPSTGILIPYLCKERDLSVLRSTMDDVWETKGSALETDSSPFRDAASSSDVVLILLH